MANQLKTKFIGNDQVKGEKVLLDNNSALRAKDSSGTAQEMMKLDATDKVIVYRSTGAEEIAYISDVNSGGTALQDHIDDPTDAHDASAISVVPTGNLAASDVQAALEELQGDLDGIDATYVNAAGDTMTGNLTIDDGMESTVYQTSGISANQALTLDSMGSTGDITLSAANVYMAGSLKNNSSGTGYISIDSPSGSVDLQGGGSEINIETANNIKLNSAKIDSMGKLQTTEVGYDNVSGQNVQFTNASVTINATILEINSSLDMNNNSISGLVNPTSNDQPLINGQLGSANGVAPLNNVSKIDTIYLPSYVDDVEEYDDLGSFPVSGEGSKIYVAKDTNKTYRWSGSTYVEISPSEVNSVNGQLGVVSLDTDDISEGSNNLYFTNTRAKSAAVSDSITDGITDVAPSQNAVYDALALKFNSADFSSSFDSNLSGKTTDNLAEGSSNLYFTNARAKSAAVSDVAYASSWDGVVDQAASKNAVYDQMELERARILALENVEPEMHKKTLVAGDITNKYIDLPHEAIETKDFHVFVDRLALHQDLSWVSGDTTPNGDDYRLSVVSGVTRIHFLNDMVSPGGQQLSTGDNIYVRYKKSL